MKRSTKIILSVFAVLAVLVVIGAGMAAFYVRKHADGWLEQGQERVHEGQAAGEGTDSVGCVNQAMDEYREDTGPISALSMRLWLGGCLQTARVDASICPELDADSTLGRVGELIAARSAFCARHRLAADQGCQQLAQAVEEFCFIPDEAPTDSTQP